MKGAFEDPKKKEQLAASFAVVRSWAAVADPVKYSAINLRQIAKAAEELEALSRRANPGEAIRHQAPLVRTMDDMIGLQKAFRQLPEDDPDRANPQLRTALRRIEDVRNKDVWHIQLT